MAWNDITTGDGYKQLSERGRARLKQRFYEENVAPGLRGISPEGQRVAFQRFMEAPDDTGEGLAASALSSAARGFLDPIPSALEVAGAYTGIESLENLGGDIRSGIEAVTPVNPAQEGFVTDAFGVLGQGVQILTTGGAGAATGLKLAGKAATKAAREQAIKFGAKAAQQGAMGASAVASGLERADQLGLEGGDRLLAGAIKGGIEFGSEALGGLGSEFGPIAKRMGLSDTVEGGFMQPIIKGMLTESPEEMVAETGGQLADLAMAPEAAPDMDFKKVAYAGLLGGVGGAAFGGIEAAVAPKTAQAYKETGAYTPVRNSEQLPPEVRDAAQRGDDSRLVTDKSGRVIGYKPAATAPAETIEAELPIEVKLVEPLEEELKEPVAAMVDNVIATPTTTATAAALAEDVESGLSDLGEVDTEANLLTGMPFQKQDVIDFLSQPIQFPQYEQPAPTETAAVESVESVPDAPQPEVLRDAQGVDVPTEAQATPEEAIETAWQSSPEFAAAEEAAMAGDEAAAEAIEAGWRNQQKVTKDVAETGAKVDGGGMQGKTPPPLSEGPYKSKNEEIRANTIARGFIWDGENWIHPAYPGATIYSDDVPQSTATRVREELAKIRGTEPVGVSGIAERDLRSTDLPNEDGKALVVAKGAGARKATKEGQVRVDAAKQRLRDIINNNDIVGKQRADMIEDGNMLIAYLQATAGRDLETSYSGGDQIALTYEDAEDGFETFIYLEGAKAGKSGVRMKKETLADLQSKKQQADKDFQAGIRRVRESGESDQLPKAKTKVAPEPTGAVPTESLESQLPQISTETVDVPTESLPATEQPTLGSVGEAGDVNETDFVNISQDATQPPQPPATQETKPQTPPPSSQPAAEETGDAGVAESATDRLTSYISTLPAKAQAAWTPERLAAAESFYSSGDAADLEPLTATQRKIVNRNRYSEAEQDAYEAEQKRQFALRNPKAADDLQKLEDELNKLREDATRISQAEPRDVRGGDTSAEGDTQVLSGERAKAVQKAVAASDWANMGAEQRRKAMLDFAERTARAFSNSPVWNGRKPDVVSLGGDRAYTEFTVEGGALSLLVNINFDTSDGELSPSAEAAMSKAYSVVEEEFMHAAHLQSAFKRWKESKDGGEFKDWFIRDSAKNVRELLSIKDNLRASGNNESADKIQDIIASVALIYWPQDVALDYLDMIEDPFIGHEFYLEAARMLAQVEVDDFTSESEFARFYQATKGFFGGLLKFLREAASMVKSGALGEALKRDVDTLASAIREMRQTATLIAESQKEPPAATYATLATDPNALIDSLSETELQQAITIRESKQYGSTKATVSEKDSGRYNRDGEGVRAKGEGDDRQATEDPKGTSIGGSRSSILRQNDGAVVASGVNTRNAEAARNSYDGVIPGVAETWLGTVAEFQEQFPDGIDWGDGKKSQPREASEAGVAADGRSYIFTDRVQVLEGDVKRAAQYFTTPSGEAVKRLLRHESFGHRGAMSLPLPLRNRFIDMIASGVIPQAELEYLVKERGYTDYADWRNNPAMQLMLAEEWLAHKMEGITAIPQSGVMAQMMDWLRDVWRWLTGSEKALLPELRDMMREMHKALGALKPEQWVVETRASLQQSQWDAAYFDALEAGDMVEAQRIVDEAAMAAGYSIEAYKAMPERDWQTENPINVIDSENGPWAGFFTDDKAVAERFGRIMRNPVRKALLKIKEPFEIDASGKSAGELQFDIIDDSGPYAQKNNAQILDAIKSGKYDAIVLKNTVDEGTISVPLNPNQIKSADPVVRDDSGAIIPPSQRFQSASNDIRYSLQQPIRNQNDRLTAEETKTHAPSSSYRMVSEVVKGLDGAMKVIPREYHPIAEKGGAQDAIKAWANKLIRPYLGSTAKLRELKRIAMSDEKLQEEFDIGARSGGVVMPTLMHLAATRASELGDDALRNAFLGISQSFGSGAGQDLWALKAVGLDNEFAGLRVKQSMDELDQESVKKIVDPKINSNTIDGVLNDVEKAGAEAAENVADALQDEEMIRMRVLELGALAQEDAELRGLLEELIAITIDLGELSETEMARESIAGRRTPLKFANAAEKDAAIEKLKSRQTAILAEIKTKLAKPRKPKTPKAETTPKEPKAPKEKQPAKAKEDKPVQTAKQIINKIITAAQRKDKKPVDADEVRELYRLDLKKPMNEEDFVKKAKEAGLDSELAVELKDAIDLELTAMAIEAEFRAESRAQDKALKDAEDEMNRYQKQAESKINEIADNLADPSLTQDKAKVANPFKKLYDQQLTNPLPLDKFLAEMSALNVFEQTATQLFNIAALDSAARLQIKQAKADIKKREISEDQASKIIYQQEEQLRQGSKDREESKSGDSINKAFREQVAKPMPLDEFSKRLDKLKVSAKSAERLFKTAARVAYDNEAAELYKQRLKFLDSDSSALAGFVNQLRTSGRLPSIENVKTGDEDIKWSEILTLPVADQETIKAELIDRVKKHSSLRNLSASEQIALVDALEAMWQRERRKIFKRMIKRADMAGVSKDTQGKIEEATPKLLKYINQGMLGSSAFYKAMGEVYNIQPISKEDRALVEKLAAEMQAPETSSFEYRQKSEQIAKILHRNSSLSWAEILSSVWVVSVLTGTATQVEMGLGFLTGLLSVVKKALQVAAQGKPGLALEGLSEFGKFLVIGARDAFSNMAFPESGILASKDSSMAAYMEKGAKGAGLTPGEKLTLIQDKPGDSKATLANNKLQRGLGMWLSLWERIMGGLDHINSTATRQGTMRLAAALNPKLYSQALIPSAQDLKNALAVAKTRMPDATRKTQQALATSLIEDGIHLLGKDLEDGFMDQWRKMIFDIKGEGFTASFQEDPSGAGGMLYSSIKSITEGLEDKTKKFRDKQRETFKKTGAIGPDSLMTLAVGELGYILATQAQNILGIRFMRFTGNKLNELISYVPVLGLARLKEEAMHRDGEVTLRGINIYHNQALATVALIAYVYMTQTLDDDEEDKTVIVEGNWASLTPVRQKQLLAAGLKENTIRFKMPSGKWLSVSYNSWPIAGWLAAFGSVSDYKRYTPEKWNAKTEVDQALAAAYAGAFAIKDISSLSQLMEMFGKSKFDTDEVKSFENSMKRSATAFGGGFVPKIFKDIDTWFDASSYKPESTWEHMAKEIPVLRRSAGAPVRDIFYETVDAARTPWRRLGKTSAPEEEYKLLGKLNAKGIWLTPPNPENRKVRSRTGMRSLTEDEAAKYMSTAGGMYKDFVLKRGKLLSEMNPDKAEAIIEKTTARIREYALKKAIARTGTAVTIDTD